MRLARARGVPVMAGPEAKVLGRSVGRNAVHAIGICDKGLAEGIRARLDSDGL